VTMMVAALGHGFEEHQCCWYADADNPCGLWCGHDGDHAPYMPGAYLPPPIISPLDLLALQLGQWPHLACPLCRARTDAVSCDRAFHVARDGDGNVTWYEREADSPGDIEQAWRFNPCGCEARQLLPEARGMTSSRH
jgi:hypothetical protein